jgi:hypothetical protein|tara:strand:- start:251 stop:475 length:225 start_codon:yes stop_codon:yes gene_type:complete
MRDTIGLYSSLHDDLEQSRLMENALKKVLKVAEKQTYRLDLIDVDEYLFIEKKINEIFDSLWYDEQQLKERGEW